MTDSHNSFERAKDHFHQGLEHIRTSNYREAEIALRKSLEYLPDRLSTLVNLAATLLRMKRFDEAEVYIEKARLQDPDHPEGLLNQGCLHRVRREHSAALLCFDKALDRKPGYAEAYNNRGIALADLNHFDAALRSFDSALSIKPDYAEAFCSRGDVLREMGRLDAAVASYEAALALDPGCEYLPGTLLYARMQICDWRSYSASVTALATRIEAGEKASPVLNLLALTPTAQLPLRCAQILVADRHPADSSLGDIPRPSAPRQRVRLGYYSADFYNHATSYLMAELFELHDKSRFETYAFSFGHAQGDSMRKRVSDAVDRFLDVREMSDEQLARHSRDLGIDIAVDLKGYTHGSRTGIFAFRAAPIQVNYLGYPGTMGADYIDYLLADRTVIPETDLRYYTEKVAHLPHCYQVNDRRRRISDETITRAALGLPDNAFVFCCFNNTYKISPDTFDSWARIMRQVENSVLWLLRDNAAAVENLRREALRRNIKAERLVFAGRVPLPDHLARHRAADLFIDTLPYNAHTTASDALWAGLPLLTLQGSAFQGRVASSLLSAIGLPELIATTRDDYEAKAIRLALEPELLNSFRTRLKQNRMTTPLFDTPLFARHIEQAYARMYERYCQGLGPETFQVSA